MITRRDLLNTAVSASAFAMLGGVVGAAEADRPLIVDTHIHCFAGKESTKFPYHPKGPYKPAAPATPEHLIECMDGAGVDRAIIVHPEPYQDDHSYLEYCLAVGKGRFKATCLFFADRERSAAKMPELVKKGGIVAARIHAYAPERLAPLDKPELKAFWKQATDLGLAIQLHFEPRWAPAFEPLIKEFADAPVLIDHLGRPFQGTPQEHQAVIGFSKYKNTIMKLSAVPKTTEYPHRDITPVIRQLIDAYGPDRMMYGGGFNADATPASYRAERERVRSYFAHLPAEDQAKILGGTAAKVFKFTERA